MNEEAQTEHKDSNDKVEAKEGKDKVVQLTEAEYKDKYIRLYAEFDNARKRMERERLEFIKYANEELIIEFLGILDDLERSIEVAKAKHQDDDAFLKGMGLIIKRIQEMLSKNGVKPIDTKGKMFDHNCHEVLMQEETDQYAEGTVLEEFQKGYTYGDRVVRTAKVKIAKAKTEQITEGIKETE